MAECLPEAAPCDKRSLSWFDWAYSIFKNICDVKAWLAAVVNKLGVAPDGTINIIPVIHEVDSSEGDVQVTVPAGALCMQAIVDDEYASTNRLGVLQGLEWVYLPAGSDFALQAITPLFNAESDGTDPTRGHGVYPAMVFRFPEGSRGVVSATYRTTAGAITEEAIA